MPTECCYYGKRAESHGDRAFHKFPSQQPQLLQLWLKNMQLGSDFMPTKNMKLCSDHFSEECLRKTGVNGQLVDGSIPSLFGKYKSACVYCSAIKTHGTNRSFHKFPIKNPLVLQKWLAALGKENYVPNETSLLCSDHFDKICFRSCKKGTAPRLRDNAVPAIFEPAISKDLTLMMKKRTSEPFQELPAAKRFRRDHEFEMEVESTNNVLSKNYSDTVIASNQQTSCASLCTDIDCESRSLSDLHSLPIAPDTHGTPTTEIIAQSMNTVNHDHHYETSPRIARRKLMASRLKIKNLQGEVRVQRQKIKRLHKRISSLIDIVSNLRRTRALPDSGLDCSETIAYNDVSMFLKRYMKNQKNVGEEFLLLSKKRQWKSQRKNNGIGISREKYPPALRSIALTLHFYSPRAYGFSSYSCVESFVITTRSCDATILVFYSQRRPGFTTESFDALKIKVTEAQNNNQEVLVALMFDEMGIKKGMQQSPSGHIRSYVDLGSDMGTAG